MEMGMMETRTGPRGGNQVTWSTRDTMVVSAIGVVLGLLQLPVIYVDMMLHTAFGPLGMATIWGLYVIPLLVAMRITQRPGAALLASLLVPLVQLPFGPGGWLMVAIWIPAGLACEIPFLLTRYRVFGLPMLLFSGALASFALVAHMYLPIGIFRLAPAVQIALVVVPLVSGAVLGGLPAKLLSDALAKTGVLSGYAIVRQPGGQMQDGSS